MSRNGRTGTALRWRAAGWGCAGTISRWIILRDAEERDLLLDSVRDHSPSQDRGCRVHRGVTQPEAAALNPRRPHTPQSPPTKHRNQANETLAA
jgi:hypothetical protein